MQFPVASVTSMEDVQVNFEAITSATITPGIPGAWRVPAFENGWASRTAVPFGYMIDPSGIVRFKGQMTVGTNGTTAFTLPSGYLPVQTDFWDALALDAAAGCFVEITDVGDVIPTYPTGSTIVSLVSVTFPAAA